MSDKYIKVSPVSVVTETEKALLVWWLYDAEPVWVPRSALSPTSAVRHLGDGQWQEGITVERSFADETGWVIDAPWVTYSTEETDIDTYLSGLGLGPDLDGLLDGFDAA
jgi:hypothetical protein